MIPPGEANAEIVAESTVGVDNAKLTYIQPHMHLRAKDYELRLIYPTGEKETVFRGKWDFDWQLGYDLKDPIVVPKGTRILTIVHYDNSPNNKWNPDPSKTVYWGPQNWDEMQSSFLGFLIPVEYGHQQDAEGFGTEHAAAPEGRRRPHPEHGGTAEIVFPTLMKEGWLRPPLFYFPASRADRALFSASRRSCRASCQ